MDESTAVAKIFSDGWDLLVVALGDWRFWFAHLATWALVARLKWIWDYWPAKYRKPLNELLAVIVCGSFSLWVFAGHPYVWVLAVGNGLANTYVFKIAIWQFEKYKPNWAKVLKSKDYAVQSTGNGGLLVREDGRRTVKLTTKQMDDYQKQES